MYCVWRRKSETKTPQIVITRGQDLRSFTLSVSYCQLTQHREDYRENKTLQYQKCQHFKTPKTRIKEKGLWLHLMQCSPIWFAKQLLVTSCWFCSLFQATKLHSDTLHACCLCILSTYRHIHEQKVNSATRLQKQGQSTACASTERKTNQRSRG